MMFSFNFFLNTSISIEGSFDKRRSQVILLEGLVAKEIVANMSIDLEPNVKKVFTYIYQYEIYLTKMNIGIYQIQCLPETRNCKILWQRIDPENKIIETDPEVASFNENDCMLTDIYRDIYPGSEVLYLCKKHIDFGYNKSIDYGLAGSIDYFNSSKKKNVFLLNLNFFGDIKKLLAELNDI